MNDALTVRVFEGVTDLAGDAQCLGHVQPVALGLRDEVFQGAAGHVLGDHVGLATLPLAWRRVIADIEHRHDVGMVAQSSHRLGFVFSRARAPRGRALPS